MEYNQIIPDILKEIFNTENEINKIKYIDYYSKVYSLVNSLEREQHKLFENCIYNYLKTLVKLLFAQLRSNIDIYFDYYNIYLEKALLADKIFMYYQNEKMTISNEQINEGLVSYIYNSLWDECILTKFYPFIIEDVNSVKNLDLDDQIFSKIEKYSLHINELNKELNNTFKFQIFEVIKLQKNLDIDKILEVINYYGKILNIFNDDSSKTLLANNIKILIKQNTFTIFSNLETIIFNIKESLKDKKIESYKIYSNIHRLIRYFDNNEYNKYITILFNTLKQHNYDNIETLIEDINIAEFMIHELSSNYYSKSEETDANYYKLFLERIIENIKENFDNNFTLELVKYINKNINNKLYFKNIDIIVSNLKNKDIFALYYKKALKSRLLNRNISNLNNESYLIDILSKDYDLIDVSRMLVMLKDYQSSIIYSKEFNNLFNNNAFVNLTTYDMWSLTPKEYDSDLLSNEFRENLNSIKNDFKSYYLINNENRNVKFVDDISTCIIDFNEVELECNYLQADLLHLFNEHEYIDLNETKLSSNLVQSLLKPKILLKKNSILRVNEKFKYSKPSLKIYKLYKSSNEDNPKPKPKIDKDLQSLVFKKEEYIDCFIMRVLKRNKDCYFETEKMYNELSENLKSKFDVDKDLYNKRINHLEDNLYLEVFENKIKYLI